MTVVIALVVALIVVTGILLYIIYQARPRF